MTRPTFAWPHMPPAAGHDSLKLKPRLSAAFGSDTSANDIRSIAPDGSIEKAWPN